MQKFQDSSDSLAMDYLWNFSDPFNPSCKATTILLCYQPKCSTECFKQSVVTAESKNSQFFSLLYLLFSSSENIFTNVQERHIKQKQTLKYLALSPAHHRNHVCLHESTQCVLWPGAVGDADSGGSF